MGMFDTKLTPYLEHFKEGQIVTLEEMKHGPSIRTEYGDSRPAMMKVNGEWYSMFGEGLSNQIDRMEAGDLPARVKLVRVPTRTKGKEVKLFIPESADAPDPDDIPF